jgi:hypothetical protein
VGPGWGSGEALEVNGEGWAAWADMWGRAALSAQGDSDVSPCDQATLARRWTCGPRARLAPLSLCADMRGPSRAVAARLGEPSGFESASNSLASPANAAGGPLSLGGLG